MASERSELKKHFTEIFMVVAGSLLFSASMNILIVPYGMYNGGFLGIAQLARIFAVSGLGLNPTGGDIAGIIYFILNIPLLLVSCKLFGRFFFAKTILCVVCYSLFLAVIPVPETPLLGDILTSCLIGGLACGAGAAVTLIAGCSGGGEEIIGLILARRHSSFSVGKFSMLLNVFVFGIGFLFFEPQTVIYSIIFSAVTYFVLDRVHLQNIMMTMIIITKLDGMEQVVFDCVQRGATRLQGNGGYSGEPSNVLLTVVSKKEAILLEAELLKADPNVFIISNEDVSVTGNFKKRI